MRYWLGAAPMAGLAMVLLTGCGSDSSSRGLSSVTITGEEGQTVSGGGCAVHGHATNTGNRRAHVHLAYAAHRSGAVIATSTADFDVDPFSNFDFGNTVPNSQGQPSSTAFAPNVSCANIDDFSRTALDVEAS